MLESIHDDKFDADDYDFYSVTYENNRALVKPGNNWLIIHSPGNTKKNNTVSFQTSDGRWLKEYNRTIVVETFQNTERFKETTTFCAKDGLFDTNSIGRTSFTFVSSLNTFLYINFKPPGSFMLLIDEYLKVSKKYATWFLKENTSE